MNLFVCLKMVVDTVEELEVEADHKSLVNDLLRFKVCDPDEHALEQALLLKEKLGGTVTVVALDSPEIDDVLFTALAKGADRAVKLEGDWNNLQGQGAAHVIAAYLTEGGKTLPSDALILTRSQANDEREGETSVYLAEQLGLPCVGIVTAVKVNGAQAVVTKEFAGGLRGEFSVTLPAVLGIQSAEKPPRYVPIAKVRAAMKSAKLEVVSAPIPDRLAQYEVERLYKPEAAGRARMLEGSPEAVAGQIADLLAQQSLI
jgi:electron transfer flavoprotein beta subunit